MSGFWAGVVTGGLVVALLGGAALIGLGVQRLWNRL